LDLRENKINLADTCRKDLCALVDGEANEVEVQRILTAMDGKSAREVRELWRRYHIASDSVRNKTFDIGLDVSGDVIVALKNQPVRNLIGSNKFSEAMLQFGVAASVAMLTIFGVQHYNNTDRFKQTSHNVKVESYSSQLNTGPAAQFPAGFKPNINVQTVSTGIISNPELKVTLDIRLSQDDRIRDHIDRKISEYYLQSMHIGRDGKPTFVKPNKTKVIPN
tara:strand:+ start:189 stop:854 length:666 start_codon:yes stop_codon:yes gene_type:complete